MPFDDEQPMSESQWARFMQRSEARAARYRELLETLLDHPDRDALIAREMGWDAEPGGDELHAEMEDPPHAELNDADEPGPETIPALVLARVVGMDVLSALRPYLQDLTPEGSDERAERLQSLVSCVLIPAARIAGGHAIGYDAEGLGGNIVCCRQALDAARTAREDLYWLETHQHLPTALTHRLAPRIDAVVTAIKQRLVALRAHMNR